MSSVAILIPTFNSEKTVAETLTSVQKNLKASHGIDKVYIADDYSSDFTVKKSKEIWTSSNTKLIVLSNEKNLGERENVNGALKKIKNDHEWILLLHSDDLVKVNWLDEMLETIQKSKPNIASISSSYDVLHLNGKIEKGEHKEGISTIIGNQKSIKNTLLSGTWWHISGCAINLKLFFESGGFHPQLPQYGDMEWVLSIFNSGLSIQYIPRSLTIYRQSESSVSSTSFKKHSDIYEYANLILYYKRLLTNWEFLDLFFRLQQQLMRRNLRSLVKQDFKRLTSSIRMSVYLIKIFFLNQRPNINFNKLQD